MNRPKEFGHYCAVCEAGSMYRLGDDGLYHCQDATCEGAADEKPDNSSRPNRGVKISDFYCEGVEAFELKGNRRVHSYGERQRKREAQGLDADTGMFRDYGDGGEDYN